MSGMHKIHLYTLGGEHAVIDLPEEGRTVALLKARAQAHFGRDPLSERLRLFFKGVELKDATACLDDFGVVDGSELSLVVELCSWKKRQGRSWCGEDKSELEVFGEVKQRSTMGINFDNYDAIPVQITGNKVEGVKPIKSFLDANLTDALVENLRRSGYERPTPAQQHSIPIMLSGRDLMACCQTGSGKTCAYMVSCLESLLRSGPPPNPNAGKPQRPCGLLLAPTRELAAGIHVEACKFSYDTGIRCCYIYGGADVRAQRMNLERGCDVLIATPGRLTDMCDRGYVSLELVQFFILEEADRILDMGFEPHVRHIVERTNMGTSSAHTRQSMMFSVCFVQEVQHLAHDFLEDYVLIIVGQVSEMISQHLVYAGELQQKVNALEKAISDHLPKDGLAVVFVETKRAADTLKLQLQESGAKVTAIHGDCSQQERDEALHACKTGANPVLVATDVAARGLDIPDVTLVVSFDMPKALGDYEHRIRRTGKAGRKSVAIAFVNEHCNYLLELGDLLHEAKQELPLWFSDLCRNKFGGRGPNSFGNTGSTDAWDAS